MIDLKLENYEKEIATKKGLSLIKFGADWCGPCRAYEPILDATEKGYKGNVDFYKVDVDESNELAGMFGIRGVPATFLMKDGKIVHSFVGVRNQNDLLRTLNELENLA